MCQYDQKFLREDSRDDLMVSGKGIFLRNKDHTDRMIKSNKKSISPSDRTDACAFSATAKST